MWKFVITKINSGLFQGRGEEHCFGFGLGIFGPKMHDESKAGKVIVQVDDGVLEFLVVLEDEKTVIDIKR